MAGQKDQKKGEGKGFAGLESLVSDVDTTQISSSAPKAQSADSTTSAAPPPSRPAQPQQVAQRQTYQEPPQPSGSSGSKRIWWIVAIVGLLWIIDQPNKKPPSPTPTSSPSVRSSAQGYTQPVQPSAPSVPQESKPPVGQDLVLSAAQIRYCLAEDIRMDAAKLVLNNYSESDVDRFNEMVKDYNSRCGSFRYHRGTLESARRDIEPNRSKLQAEGRGRFVSKPVLNTNVANSVTTDHSASSESFLQETLLKSLTLKPGTNERMLDSGKMIVAFANHGYVNLKPDARIDYSDYRFFKKPAYIFGHEIIVIDEEYFKEWVGCCVDPGISITLKVNGNVRFLQEFALNNKCRLDFDGDGYYGPALPSAPKGTYVTLSCKEFFVQGSSDPAVQDAPLQPTATAFVPNFRNPLPNWHCKDDFGKPGDACIQESH